MSLFDEPKRTKQEIINSIAKVEYNLKHESEWAKQTIMKLN